MSRSIGKIYPSSLLYEAGNATETLSLGEQVQPQLALIDAVLEDEDNIQCARGCETFHPRRASS